MIIATHQPYARLPSDLACSLASNDMGWPAPRLLQLESWIRLLPSVSISFSFSADTPDRIRPHIVSRNGTHGLAMNASRSPYEIGRMERCVDNLGKEGGGANIREDSMGDKRDCVRTRLPFAYLDRVSERAAQCHPGHGRGCSTYSSSSSLNLRN